MPTILVVDDHADSRRYLVKLLGYGGHRLVEAAAGAEALRQAQQERPDLIITDYHMPRLSGLELCRRLKMDPATARIPAIMLTARGYHLEPHDTEESGIRRMLSKPFSPRQLLITVNEVILSTEAELTVQR